MDALTVRILLAAGWLLLLSGGAQAQTLAAIRASHHLTCATVQNLDDWSQDAVHGDLSALGGEICRAVAVAILGNAEGLTLQPFPLETDALKAVQAGSAQLAVGITPEAATGMHFGVGFGPPVFYDSQRIMVSKRSGIATLTDLRDRLICARDLSPPERTLRDEMTALGIPYALASHSEQGEMDAAIAVRRCAAGTGMESRLAQSRANFHALVTDFVFLPDRLSLNPVVPAYRYGDQALGLIVAWTVGALIEAEALGIAQANVGDMTKRGDMRADQLLGHDFSTAQALGLARDWTVKVIATTGNYGEIFRRSVGARYALDRGLNALWTQGGLMAPPPMR